MLVLSPSQAMNFQVRFCAECHPLNDAGGRKFGLSHSTQRKCAQAALGIILGGCAISCFYLLTRKRTLYGASPYLTATMCADCPGHHPRRRRWFPPLPADQKARKAGRAAGRQLPPHRHSRLQLHQFQRQQDLLPHAVQLGVAQQASVPGICESYP